jgi:hypothetical protein
MELQSIENKNWWICYRWNTTGPLEWTGVAIMELRILLQIASNVQSCPSVILKLVFLRLCLRLIYNSRQIARDFERQYFHASPLKNKFSSAIVKMRKLLNTESVNLTIWR